MKDDRKDLNVLDTTDIECNSNLIDSNCGNCPFRSHFEYHLCRVGEQCGTDPADDWLEDIHYEWMLAVGESYE